MPDMRFAPPTALRVTNPAGLNQTNVRTHNERIVLSLLRQNRGLSKVEIGQISGLSSQAVSVIVRALEEDGLCKRGVVQKGKVGPPSTPMQINPDGAYSIGVQIGPAAADILLLDFAGEIRQVHTITYSSADSLEALTEISASISTLRSGLPKSQAQKIVGLGLAVPADIDDWALPLAPAPESVLPSPPDIETFFEAETGLGVYVQDDVAAAITGEVLFGAAKDLDDFAYLFIGRHPEIRLVLNHRIQARPAAGNQAELPTITNAVEKAFSYLVASAGPEALSSDRDTGAAGDWVREGAVQIVKKIAALQEFIPLQTVVLDGRLPEEIQKRLVDEIGEALSEKPKPKPPEIRAGEIGVHCKAYGAACLPIYSRYMLEEVSLP